MSGHSKTCTRRHETGQSFADRRDGLGAGDAPHPGKMLDMTMLSQVGGQERTEAEYDVLLRNAGFRLTHVIKTSSPASIVEAVPA